MNIKIELSYSQKRAVLRRNLPVKCSRRQMTNQMPTEDLNLAPLNLRLKFGLKFTIEISIEIFFKKFVPRPNADFSVAFSVSFILFISFIELSASATFSLISGRMLVKSSNNFFNFPIFDPSLSVVNFF